MSSTGDFTKCLCGLLWHITCHHDYFKERAAVLPNFVTNFFYDHNDYIKKKQSKPKLLAVKLNNYVEDLSTFLAQPWMSRHPGFSK